MEHYVETSILRKMSLVFVAAASLIVGIMATPAGAATASATTLQQDIDQQLASFPGGMQVSANEVAYDGGSAVVVFPDSTGNVPTDPTTRPEMSPDAHFEWHGCPYGNITAWYCFYQNAKFGGRMLEFKDCSGSGVKESLAKYGFANQTSGWVNTIGIEPLSTPAHIGVWHGGTQG
jgi:hypothetical protein